MYAFRLEVSGAGALDGTTPFDLLPPAAPPDADDITVQEITSVVGRINHSSVAPLVGNRGYLISQVWALNSSAPNFLDFGIVPPGATIVTGTTVGLVGVTPYQSIGGLNTSGVMKRDVHYVPPGWEIILLGLSQQFNGPPFPDDYSISFSLDPIPNEEEQLDLFRSVRPWWPRAFSLL